MRTYLLIASVFVCSGHQAKFDLVRQGCTSMARPPSECLGTLSSGCIGMYDALSGVHYMPSNSDQASLSRGCHLTRTQ